MSAPVHTYGPSCLLHTGDEGSGIIPESSPSFTPPKVRAQFFYTSSLLLDDPLTSLPPPTSSSAQAKHPPRPFSVRDNVALEEAWQDLRIQWEKDRAEQEQTNEGSPESANHQQLPLRGVRANRSRSSTESVVWADYLSKDLDTETLISIALKLARGHAPSPELRGQGYEDPADVQAVRDTAAEVLSASNATTRDNAAEVEVEEINKILKGVIGQISGLSNDPGDERLAQVREVLISTAKNPPGETASGRASKRGDSDAEQSPVSVKDGKRITRKRGTSSPDRGLKMSKRRTVLSSGIDEEHSGDEGTGVSFQAASSSLDTNISGSPFARVPPRRRRKRTPSDDGAGAAGGLPRSGKRHGSVAEPKDKHSASQQLDETVEAEPSTPEPDVLVPQTAIPVGASRLHLVELPSLQMKPIYWSPVHDISSVMRATWFYKDSMLPVDADLANQLEAGYEYLRPWTETWQDELNSCVENGPEAEMKIVYRLWPKEEPNPASRPGTAQDMTSMPPKTRDNTSSTEATRLGLTFHENYSAAPPSLPSDSAKLFKNSSVIYVNAKDAQILRPSLLPSVSRNRRPLSSIRKGRQIGIAVVRGFNFRMWDRLHPPKQDPTNLRFYLREKRGTAHSFERGRQQVCYACEIEERRPSVTDLVFVIHGIGQKLSERVESFHFTHAINAFRRQINVELNSDAVWPHMRPDLGGIMVLPINWRSTLSLDVEDEDSSLENPDANQYSLKDITPESIPTVRNLISDVMLDIPYYLSHHKQKMVQAVVKEANRVFRLWCHNNPGFQDGGRVHLIAHSLGSVMAIDILSHQPTKIPHIDLTTDEIGSDMFEFDTKSVFLCGSPAGFFLLLNKAKLLPRKGRGKPGQEGEDEERGVAGEAGTYGCLAVDNLYNIMHYNDPITYRVNAAVDSGLAESLRPATIPSSSATILQSVGSVFRWGSSPGAAFSPAASSSLDSHRPTLVSKLPSTIEMETHDFTREEVAEKRMSLLNDNGQIDYYISGGGGPLNIQYLNMLSAHSSYWILRDFARFLVVEIGRRQGRDGTLLALRAEKKKGWK